MWTLVGDADTAMDALSENAFRHPNAQANLARRWWVAFMSVEYNLNIIYIEYIYILNIIYNNEYNLLGGQL